MRAWEFVNLLADFQAFKLFVTNEYIFVEHPQYVGVYGYCRFGYVVSYCLVICIALSLRKMKKIDSFVN